MLDSLTVLAGSATDTAGRVVASQVVSDSATSLADCSRDLHALVFLFAVFITLCGVIGWAVECFKKKSIIPFVDTALRGNAKPRTIALLWTAANIITGGIILVAVRNASCNALTVLLWGVLALSALAAVPYTVCFVKNKRTQTKETLLGLLDKFVLEILWVFWLVFSGYYIASDIVPLENIVFLWRNWRDYTSWLIVDFCSIFLITIRVMYILIKYKKSQK